MRPGNYGYGIRYRCVKCGSVATRYQGEAVLVCIWDYYRMVPDERPVERRPVKRVELT